MADAQTHKLVEFSKEESEEVSSEIKAVLDKHDGMFNILRSIDGEGRIQATLQVFKKVPLETGVPSPIQAEDLNDNGGNNREETEEEADNKAA